MSNLDTGVTEGEKMGKREPLKLGERVAAYDADGRVTGTITAFGTHGVLGIEDRYGKKICLHEKQCRRLIPRKRAAPSVKRLLEMVTRAGKLLAEGKAKFAPHTTNSFVDDWLSDFKALALEETQQ